MSMDGKANRSFSNQTFLKKGEKQKYDPRKAATKDIQVSPPLNPIKKTKVISSRVDCWNEPQFDEQSSVGVDISNYSSAPFVKSMSTTPSSCLNSQRSTTKKIGSARTETIHKLKPEIEQKIHKQVVESKEEQDMLIKEVATLFQKLNILASDKLDGKDLMKMNGKPVKMQEKELTAQFNVRCGMVYGQMLMNEIKDEYSNILSISFK